MGSSIALYDLVSIKSKLNQNISDALKVIHVDLEEECDEKDSTPDKVKVTKTSEASPFTIISLERDATSLDNPHSPSSSSHDFSNVDTLSKFLVNVLVDVWNAACVMRFHLSSIQEFLRKVVQWCDHMCDEAVYPDESHKLKLYIQDECDLVTISVNITKLSYSHWLDYGKRYCTVYSSD
jgi:hypothetical protein